MNEFERQIRELNLREPGDTLDQRVLSSLQETANVAARDSGGAANASSAATNSSPMNKQTRMRRGRLSGTVSGLIATLLIGIVIGNMLPSIWMGFRGSAANRSVLIPAEGRILATHEVDSGDAAGDEEVSERHPMTPEQSQDLRDALQNRSMVGSQFVESVYLSAIAGASRWERQNGEKFSVSTHVSDRRFDMCRDCHRVGG
jgi:hypothetical protein